MRLTLLTFDLLLRVCFFNLQRENVTSVKLNMKILLRIFLQRRGRRFSRLERNKSFPRKTSWRQSADWARNGESPFRWWIYATLWVAIVHIHFAPRYLSTGVRALDRVPGLGTEHLRPTSRVLVSTAIPTSTSLHQTAGHILCVERSEVWTLKIKVRLLHLSICRIPVKIKVPEPSLQIFYSSSCLSYWWLVEVGGMAHCNRTPSTFDPAGLESHSQASCQNVTGWFESLTILVLMVDSNYPSTVDFFDNIFTFINELVMLSQMRYLAA